METPSLAGDIRARRLAAGLSQVELAERAGCSWSTVRLFDRGYMPAYSEKLARVLAVLEQIESKPKERFANYTVHEPVPGDTNGPLEAA